MDKEDLKKAIQAAQDMQVDLIKIQSQLMREEIIGQSNNRKISIAMNGQGDFKSIKIAPDLLAEGLHTLEASILEALKDATNQAAKLTKDSIENISKQIGL